jgi:hypothetical protein
MATRPIVRQQVQRVVDNRAVIQRRIAELAAKEVLVGIPADTSARTEPGTASNALLGYVHEHGVPEHNLPARPWLRPGVADKLDQIQRYLRQAGTLALRGDGDGMLNALRAAGQTGATGAQQKITTGPFAPLSERTIIARLRKTKAGQTRLRRMRRAGQDVVAWGQANLKPLIDTGQMRRAVTFIVRSRRNG